MYKGKYLIGVYAPVSEGETLLGLCNSVREFAKFAKIKEPNADQILRMLFTHQTHFIRLFGKMCTVEFILDVEVEYA